jgi:two-component system, LytTR family, sensor kinase
MLSGASDIAQKFDLTGKQPGTNWLRIGSHVLFWSVFVLLNALFACFLRKMSLEEGLPKAIMAELFVLPVKAGLTYLVFYYLIPQYLDDRRKIRALVLVAVGVFAVAILLYRLMLAYVYFPIFRPERVIKLFYGPGIYLTAFDLSIALAVGLSIKLVRMNYRSRELEQQLQQEKLQSELNFLRAQTNPHFLFNTLNNLYGLARKKSDQTPAAIMMLSKILRFMLYDCREPRIPISAEAKVIQDYIELEKLRYTDRLQVRYSEQLSRESTPIAPLLLLPFVENSFKHGAHGSTGAVEINIDLRLDNQGTLEFDIDNTAEAPRKHSSGDHGIGLQNVRRQLDLIYPDQYELNISPEEGWYRVRLKIWL